MFLRNFSNRLPRKGLIIRRFRDEGRCFEGAQLNGNDSTRIISGGRYLEVKTQQVVRARIEMCIVAVERFGRVGRTRKRQDCRCMLSYMHACLELNDCLLSLWGSYTHSLDAFRCTGDIWLRTSSSSVGHLRTSCCLGMFTTAHSEGVSLLWASPDFISFRRWSGKQGNRKREVLTL